MNFVVREQAGRASIEREVVLKNFMEGKAAFEKNEKNSERFDFLLFLCDI